MKSSYLRPIIIKFMFMVCEEQYGIDVDNKLSEGYVEFRNKFISNT